VSLWHERDISHSSVERMIAPDATATLAFMLERAAGVVEGLVAYPEKMRENLAASGELFFSEAVLLALVDKGLGRQRAYEIVQKSAMKAFAGEGQFRTLLESDPEVRQYIDAEQLARCFDLGHALRWADAIIDRALKA
jgi:adenylosuccinate lyase